VYMILSRLSGDLSADEGEQILDQLLSLVITDPDLDTYGCMRWYKEETQVWDTNAAFFTLMPFLVLETVSKEALSDREWERVRELCRRTAPWFEKEAADPHWYYPNKVISDVAVLWGVGCFLGEPEFCAKAGAFAEEWIRYTQERGWGWGENISLGYIPVILVAIRFLIRSGQGQPWVDAFEALEEELLEIVQFCDGKECVPSIRSYNFSGEEQAGKLLQWIIGDPDVPDTSPAQGDELPWKSLLIYLLYANREEIWRYTPEGVPRCKTIRTFDGHDAVSWVGEGIRLGSCSRFPVMPGHYQHENWGLGWQCFPVSALIEGGGVGRLQWRTETQGSINTHPTSGPNGIYRNYRIFGNNDCAEPVTLAKQEGPLALVVRSVKHAVLEEGPAVCDEWWFPPGSGSLTQAGAWWILEQGSVALAIMPLQVYDGTGSVLQAAEPVAIQNEEGITLRVPVLQESGSLKVCERFETAWVIRAVPLGERERLSDLLAGIRVSDRIVPDSALPRVEYAYVRRLEVFEEATHLQLEVDYHLDLP